MDKPDNLLSKNVNYDVLDRAKAQFISAAKRTLKFAESYGFVPSGKFGASANIFSLDLSAYLKKQSTKYLYYFAT